MSLSTLDDKVSKYQQYPVDLLDALKTLKYQPKQVRPKTRNEDNISTAGGRVGLSKDHSTKNTYKRTNDEFPLEKLVKRKPKNVQPLGRTRAHNNTMSLDLIPKLRRLDTETEKEREIQRVMNNLKLNKRTNHRAATTSSKKKETYGITRSGMDLTSSLMEGHNLTLRQLREFWSDMPSFLSIQAASLKSKYGVLERDCTDIDDISIEIVKKWNKPGGTILPQIAIKTPSILHSIQEEQIP